MVSKVSNGPLGTIPWIGNGPMVLPSLSRGLATVQWSSPHYPVDWQRSNGPPLTIPWIGNGPANSTGGRGFCFDYYTKSSRFFYARASVVVV
jgi:hypothetical protein